MLKKTKKKGLSSAESLLTLLVSFWVEDIMSVAYFITLLSPEKVLSFMTYSNRSNAERRSVTRCCLV